MSPTAFFILCLFLSFLLSGLVCLHMQSEEEMLKRGARYRWNHPAYMQRLHDQQPPMKLPEAPPDEEHEDDSRPLSWLEIIARGFALAAVFAVVAFLVFGFA